MTFSLRLFRLAFVPLLLGAPFLAAQNAALDISVPPMRAVIERYTADHETIAGVYTDSNSPASRERWAAFYKENRAALAAVSFSQLDREGQADYVLFDNLLTQQEHQLALDEKQWNDVERLLPFAPAIFSLEDAKRRMERPDAQKAALTIDLLAKDVAASRKELEDKVKDATPADRIAAWRAAAALDQLSEQLKKWFEFSNGYDPTFTWWVAEPYKKAAAAMKDDATFLREKAGRHCGRRQVAR